MEKKIGSVCWWYGGVNGMLLVEVPLFEGESAEQTKDRAHEWLTGIGYYERIPYLKFSEPKVYTI